MGSVVPGFFCCSVEALGLLLLAAHLAVPLAYYVVASGWARRSWGLAGGNRYPYVTVVVPTYNEARNIAAKLDNVYEQDYPRDRLEVLVVDSGSTDGTPRVVREWARGHPELRVRLLVEEARRGKASALNRALREARGEVVVATDADALWEGRDALRRVVAWLSAPGVGAVSCVKRPLSAGFGGVEAGYRGFYNVLRVGESKAWSTPVFHGELAAFGREVLRAMGGFPETVGADDSYAAVTAVLHGYRAIVVDDVVCLEAVPRGRGYHSWRVRRAQHLAESLALALPRVLRSPRAPRVYKAIVLAEAYLHLANPWLLVASVLLLSYAALQGGLVSLLALLSAPLLVAASRLARVWLASQLYLIAGMLRRLRTRDIVWEKQEKTVAARGVAAG